MVQRDNSSWTLASKEQAGTNTQKSPVRLASA